MSDIQELLGLGKCKPHALAEVTSRHSHIIPCSTSLTRPPKISPASMSACRLRGQVATVSTTAGKRQGKRQRRDVVPPHLPSGLCPIYKPDLIYVRDNTPSVFPVVLVLVTKVLFQFLLLKLDALHQADGRKHYT